MLRKRLTITLRKDLIEILDAEIDGVRIRNRSHAIESMLAYKLNLPVSKAVILAADQGIKFRPFTYEMPKAMLPVGGRPLLEHIIIGLRESDIRDIYISVGHLADKIKSYFGNGSKFGVRITYSVQNRSDLGTGGALRTMKPNLGPQEAFFLIYGDVLADINYQDMVRFYYGHRDVLGVVALTTVRNPEFWGVVKLEGEYIKDFIEKPEPHATQSHLISAGIYLLKGKIFSHLPRDKSVSLEKDILPKLIKKYKLLGYLLKGSWYDISTPEVYDQVLKARLA
ncbi:MAG: hypothetical protein A2445_02635 [Candidatus Jacksonbacteria bacterium RIFOXYC2_FULL_44_29]|nr:MAG: Nucleotidyl transferase [Parcubacteria group bacterium GW2011_GWA2_42_28]KKT55899.1 MAG: Nucleotidyl transferase [Parcubacteria group bacterium GW2011_GWC2_44_22]OGY74513.1 MAG: hypothetical protein A2240_02890 [Candidatus Jacksonbacteria bacterium RIFOXYA2_FULL_43_12]OGY77422.1 MAG: hypothetical protein A2295_01840 [Candidatus Jacksonbacteria bacterium RIFOXYB2_FULL_44_15]OGY78194.1 MAG: hypothetical protein A2550_06185 [Candidatus Jacksonbacteria bacterium RIFOXYD2_FULL_43_21]OGY8077